MYKKLVDITTLDVEKLIYYTDMLASEYFRECRTESNRMAIFMLEKNIPDWSQAITVNELYFRLATAYFNEKEYEKSVRIAHKLFSISKKYRVEDTGIP